jgi:hypothetical protein
MPARCGGRASKVANHVLNTTFTLIKLDLSFHNLKKKLVLPSCMDMCLQMNTIRVIFVFLLYSYKLSAWTSDKNFVCK